MTMTVGTTEATVVLLCGYYGEDNLGDDALLQVLLQDLPWGSRPLITARNSASVQRFCADATVVNRRSVRAVLGSVNRVQAVIFGGGSLLQDSTSQKSLFYYVLLILWSRCRGRRIFLWGQGLGPLDHRLSRLIVRWVLPLCTSASWRDQRSLELARSWAPNLPSCIGPDPVWQMPMQSWTGGVSIVLSWRPTPLLDRDGWRRLLSAVDQLATELDAPVHWLAFHQHQDANLLNHLCDLDLVPETLMHRSDTLVPNSIQEVFDVVRTARIVLPMRLHALILARLTCCPMAALSYDPKVEAAASMSGVVWSALRPLPSRDQLFTQWRSVVDQPADPSAVQEIRDRASAHAEWLKRHF